MAQHEQLRVPLVNEVGFQILTSDTREHWISTDEFSNTHPIIRHAEPLEITAYGQPLIPIYLMLSDDEKESIIIGRNGIALSTLKYAGFNDFAGRALGVLDKFGRRYAISSIDSMSLTYINLVPKHGSDRSFSGLSAKLEFPPIDQGKDFLYRGQGYFEFANPSGKLRINFASLDDYGAELSLDYTVTAPVFTSHDDIAVWLSDAHNRIYDGFTALLNPDLLKAIR